MINMLGPPPGKDIYLAWSGGVDSMFALSFLKTKRWRNITLAFFHHNTQNSEDAWQFLNKYIQEEYEVDIVVDTLKGTKPKRTSPEEFWRNARYDFLHSLDGEVVMAHHLDDCVENWLFTSLHGKPRVIPYRNNNIIRPFLLTKKKKMIDWCCNNEDFWVEDTSNKDTKYMRNYIRKYMVPHALQVNPGLHRVVARQVQLNSGDKK